MDLSRWTALDFAPPDAMEGRHARLQRLSPDAHADALHAANGGDAALWRFMSMGPFPTREAYRAWAAAASGTDDPAFYAIHGARGWAGVASLMRIDRDNGVIEIGSIAFSPVLRRTAAATEALHLMIDHAFTAGFRRVEWKCDAANAASRRAAARLGFAYEGTFRQHMVVKGANRDTVWFAILDRDWPALRAAHRAWLSPETFDADGRQTRSLSEMIAPLVRRTD